MKRSFSNFLNLYFNQNGAVSRADYLIGITIAVISMIALSFHYLHSIVVRNLSFLLSWPNDSLSYKLGGFNILYRLPILLIVPLLYGIYNLSLKRGKTIALSKPWCLTLAIAFTLMFWMVLVLIDFGESWREVAKNYVNFRFTLTLFSVILGLGSLFKLIQGTTTHDQSQDRLKTQRSEMVLLGVSGAIITLWAVCIFVATSTSVLLSIRIITLLLLFGVLAFVVGQSKPELKAKAWLVFGVWLLVEALYALVACYVVNSTILFAANTFISHLELLMLLLVLGACFSLAPDNEQTDHVLFKNKILTLLFNPQGKISSREYMAGLLLVFWSWASYVIIFSRSHIDFTEVIDYRQSPLSFFSFLYQFVIVYSSLILTIKRARAKMIDPYLSWIIAIIISLCSLMILLNSENIIILKDYISQVMPRLELDFYLNAVLALISIPLFIVLWRKSEYDKLNDKNRLEENTPMSYLFQTFYLTLLFLPFFCGAIFVLPDFIIYIRILYLIFLVIILVKRAMNASRSIMAPVWVILTVIVYEGSLLAYVFERSSLLLFFADCCLFAHFILIALPSVEERNFGSKRG